VEEIEDRANPLVDSSEDRDRYRVRSSVGFLDPGESLIARLTADSHVVRLVGTTHHNLASQLESLLRQSQSEREKMWIGPDPEVCFEFTYQAHSQEKIVPKPQLLHVSHRSFAGSQWSFFRNLAPTAEPNFENTVSWKEDHEIWNDAFPSIVLTIAGGIGTGICHFISKHGFYEGGASNPYRVAPAVLHWVLTGIPSTIAIQSMHDYYEASNSALVAKYELDLRELSAANPPLTEEALSAITQHLRRSHEEEVGKWDEKLEALRIMAREVQLGAVLV